MIAIRPSTARGETRLDWLDSKHSFSFGDYHDPDNMGFRALRVINDDVVAPGRGFGTHPHRDMEIVTVVLEGALEHRDSTGGGEVLRPGEVQRMTAGRGIAHSEFNPSPSERAHFLQIWIVPERRGLEPGYEQRAFPEAARRGKLALVAAREPEDGALKIHQDARLYVGAFADGERARLELAPGRHAWVHVATGAATVNGRDLAAGDAAALSGEAAVDIAGRAGGAQVLVFDLA